MCGEGWEWGGWPEQGKRKDADDEEAGDVDEHPGQCDLLGRHATAGRRPGAPPSSLSQLHRRYYRRRRHHNDHDDGQTNSVHGKVQGVHKLPVLQVELAEDGGPNLPTVERIRDAHYGVFTRREEEEGNDDDVDDADDDGYGGGPHEGLRAEGLQDADASLAGDDSGDDLGDPSEPVEAQQVVVDKEPHKGTVPEIMI